MECTILCQLPNELKIKIWSYLSSLDIMKIENADVFKCNCVKDLSYDRNFVRKLDFTGEYGICFAGLKSFLQPRRDIITSLNINFAYWVPKGVIVSAVIQLRGLKLLNALDTKFRYEHLQEIEHKNSKMEKVAVSLHGVPRCRRLNVISQVNILFYYYRDSAETRHTDGFDKLQETPYKYTRAILVDTVAETILKYSINANAEYYDDSNEYCKSLDCHRFHRKRKSLYLCYINVIMGFVDNVSPNALKLICERNADAEELYVGKCSDSDHPRCPRIFNLNLVSVSQLSRLKILTLDIMAVHSLGTSLKYILSYCKNLQILRLRIGNFLPILRSLYSALSLSTSLKTLCVKYNHVIDCVELLSVLLKSPFNLDRLVIDVVDLRNLSEKDIHTFIAANPQLKFIYFIVKYMPQVAVRNVQKILNSYCVGNAQRIYKISSEISMKYGKDLIPAVHYIETISRTNAMGPIVHDLNYWLSLDD